MTVETATEEDIRKLETLKKKADKTTRIALAIDINAIRRYRTRGIGKLIRYLYSVVLYVELDFSIFIPSF